MTGVSACAKIDDVANVMAENTNYTMTVGPLPTPPMALSGDMA